jgi:hypothetical protein
MCLSGSRSQATVWRGWTKALGKNKLLDCAAGLWPAPLWKSRRAPGAPGHHKSVCSTYSCPRPKEAYHKLRRETAYLESKNDPQARDDRNRGGRIRNKAAYRWIQEKRKW